MINKLIFLIQLQIESMLPLPGVAGMPATRSTNDRIFVFVNMRPVAFVDITKVCCFCFEVNIKKNANVFFT